MNIIERFKIEVYNIGFITKGIDAVMNKGVGKDDIIWLKHRYKDRFFADPFLLDSDEQYLYILCEEYMFFEEKGKITLLTVEKNTYKLNERRVIIEENTHLSFPYCKYRGYEITPESSASGKCVRYIIERKKNNVLSKKTLIDKGLIDPVSFKDDEGEWLYAGELKVPSTELYVYKDDSNGKFVSVREEPILSDNRHARGAGDFFEWKGKIYRPVQDCEGRYGRQTKIMEMEKVGKQGYQAKEHITVNSFDNPPYNLTMHTFNVYKDCIIVDGSNDFIKFPVKFFYRYCRFLFKNRLR